MSLEFDVEISKIPNGYRAYSPELRVNYDYYTIEESLDGMEILVKKAIAEIMEKYPMPADEMIKLIEKSKE